MNISPINKEAYQLLHDGSLALAVAEQRGMRVDVPYLETQSKHLERKIKYYKEELETDPEIKVWKKKYRNKFNLASDEQLTDILFNVLGYKSNKKTASGLDSADKLTLSEIDSPMVNTLLNIRTLEKTKSTYIDGLLSEQVDGILRPSFNLNIPVSYRSSSNNPNFQNMPVRDLVMAKMIRRAFIPRKDFVIVEPDYSGIEVRGAGCASNDPNLLMYIRDKSKDMHRDMCMQIYKLDEFQWTKNTRYCAKNKFVFPQFYGDWYRTCAKALWDAITEMNLVTRDGTPLKKHLASKGIKNYQQFEDHIKDVEYDFWNIRFGVYGKWKEDIWKDYQRNGFIDCMTGFRFQEGAIKKNELLNRPIQGPAFHCLLKSFIEVTRISQENNWKSGPIGQIHDSMPTEVHKDEYNMVLDTIQEVMCNWVPKQWPWIIVPLDIEIEVSPLEGSWYLKKEVQKSPECPECGAHWMYELKDKETGNFIAWNCPICREDVLIPF